MGIAAKAIVLSAGEREELEHLVRSPSTAQGIVQRALAILELSTGLSISDTAQHLCTWRKTVSYWRGRWLASPGDRKAIERLSDAPRSGAKPRITPEETCSIVALACKPPADYGLPLSHWSASDLARQALRQGLVSAISPRTAGRILKRCRSQAAPSASLADAEVRPRL